MRRRALATIALVPLAAVPLAWSNANSRQTSIGHSSLVNPMSVERETGCPGQWRWPVKTLTDSPDNSSVSFSSKLKTVAQLGGLAKPSVPINNHTLYVPRQPGPEMKTYRVNAVL